LIEPKPADDARWMGAALALGERARGRTAPNPNVGCVIVADGRVVGRGWTQAGGRPHAEAMALAQAGAAARGATAYVTLEPCAHVSDRGPACSDLLIASGIARVVVAIEDPDRRTAGQGLARLAAAGVATRVGVRAPEARAGMAGFLTRQRYARPFVTLKLATSLDGGIAMADGRSQWITGAAARSHAHLERSRHESILVGRGTWDIDAPRLDVRLAGLEPRSPMRVVLSSGGVRHPRGGEGPASSLAGEEKRDPRLREDDGMVVIASPEEIAGLRGVDHLLVEGGAGAAAAFLAAGLVDRLLLYRAPILIGGGRAALGDIGLGDLSAAHGCWRLDDARQLGVDRLEVYGRA
jgi:diaminohydroxyphosphoribosylaminopyrimidine deaminase/5-amino-6-(5-phosphoribosylamino)uracil reductase